jgi:GNAT superfamily N-acetyltransferase
MERLHIAGEQTIFMNSSASPEPEILPASDHEISTLVRHHLRMFEDIWEKKGISFPKEVGDKISASYNLKLRTELNSGSCSAWIGMSDGSIVSSGAVSIVSYVPNPNDTSGKVAFVHSIYTEKEFRNQGFASSITRKAIQFCRDEGVGRVYLFASADGRPVYEKEGFVPVDNLMVLFTMMERLENA